MSEVQSKVLVKFRWDCGRAGDVHGLFITTPGEIEKAIGREVNFGEILGKHSEVCGTLEDGEFKVVLDDQAAIAALEKACGATISGHNPLDVLRERDEDAKSDWIDACESRLRRAGATDEVAARVAAECWGNCDPEDTDPGDAAEAELELLGLPR